MAPKKRWEMFIAILGCSTFVLFMTYKVSFNWYDEYKVLQEERHWSGFGPEQGNYSFTVVTGLFDIGRGRWMTSWRTYNDYLGYLLQILKLDVNLIVFIEKKGVPFVERNRRGREGRTRIYEMDIMDLEYFPLLKDITNIMQSQQFQVRELVRVM
ncbi:uncharacterized protein LOC106011611 [Aplysia californica]|uniref:Uncharacterized protein LOC106011611 n=1 Tax=Aplysia californica TaxID=6500 RepID=A0ABM0ZYQ3_APLCA|nr:uncharacterized protein LOC106011611 [Aplysia californica]